MSEVGGLFLLNDFGVGRTSGENAFLVLHDTTGVGIATVGFSVISTCSKLATMAQGSCKGG